MDHPKPPSGTGDMKHTNDKQKDKGTASEDVLMGIVLADRDMAITHVNGDFSKITGYTCDEVCGRNCNFLQGPETSKNTVQVIRDSLCHERRVQVALLNYRKDGTPFWNYLTICPLVNAKGHLDAYIGIQMTRMGTFVDRPMELFEWTAMVPKQAALPPSGTASASSSSSSKPISVAPKVGHEKKSRPKTVLPRSDVTFVAETALPTRKGTYRVRAYHHPSGTGDITCIIFGDIEKRRNVPVRVHDQCFTSEVLGSLKCDCKEQLDYAMDYIRDSDGGMVIYLPQEGRGIGLANKVKVYSLQERGYDTVDSNLILGFPADAREYSCVPSILDNLDIASVQLLTNNPEKIDKLTALGVEVTKRLPVLCGSNTHSEKYLHTKSTRMGHML